MPTTTDVYGWPKPVNTDRVTDGWDAIADLAEAIEDTVKALPRGVKVAATPLPAAYTPTQAAVDCFGTKALVLESGRQYKVTVNVDLIRGETGDQSVVQLNVDGTSWHQVNMPIWQANQAAISTTLVSYINGAGVSKDFRVDAIRASGAGNISLAQAGTLGSNVLIIEDMGLVPA